MANLNFKTAFKYPFNRAKGMWNVLWILLPIIGWFALGGYGVRIIQEFIKGQFKELPVFKFESDLKLGFWMFLKALPFVILYAVISAVLTKTDYWAASLVDVLIAIFIVPILTINFMCKETIESYFDFKILKSVFNNLGDYIVALLKSILLGIVFVVMIIILVGIPASAFSKNIFMADFYRRRVK